MKHEPYSNDPGQLQGGNGNLIPYSFSTTMLDRDDPGERSEYPQKWRAAAAASNARFLAALGGRA